MLLTRHDSIEAASAALSAQIGSALHAAIRARATASLLVPGGRTPVALFRELRRQRLDWSCVTIGLTDERWVPSEHADSNARLVRHELLVGAAAAAGFVPLHNAAPTAAQGAAQSWRMMQAMPRPFDVTVLGMGDDGHFASLFPGSPGVGVALDAGAAPGCVAMQAPVAPCDRLSLNLAALAQSRRLVLFITGQHKLELVESTAGRAPLPVDSLLSLCGPEPEVYWAP